MKRWIIIAVALVAAFFLWGVVAARQEKDRDANGPATEIRGAVPVGDAFLLHEVVDRQDVDRNRAYRLTLLGVADGKVRARAVVGEDARACAPAGASRIWCYHGKGVELRDVATLAVVADESKIVAVVGATLMDWHPTVDLATGEIAVHSSKGDDVLINPALVTRPGKVAATDGGLPLDYSNPRSRSVGASTKPTTKGEGSRVLVAGRPFLAPILLGDVEGGKTTIVLGKSSLDEKLAKSTLTSVGADGDMRWELEDAPGVLRSSYVNDDVAAVVLTGYALGVDAKSGQVRYRFDGSTTNK